MRLGRSKVCENGAMTTARFGKVLGKAPRQWRDGHRLFIALGRIVTENHVRNGGSCPQKPKDYGSTNPMPPRAGIKITKEDKHVAPKFDLRGRSGGAADSEQRPSLR
jgi:hypothetical protein